MRLMFTLYSICIILDDIYIKQAQIGAAGFMVCVSWVFCVVHSAVSGRVRRADLMDCTQGAPVLHAMAPRHQSNAYTVVIFRLVSLELYGLYSVP